MRFRIIVLSGVLFLVCLGGVRILFYEKYFKTERSVERVAMILEKPSKNLLKSTLPSAELTPEVLQAGLQIEANGLSRMTVIMETTAGEVQFKFYSQDAPKTVNRIVALIQKGFYDGLRFHRVIPGFVVQGGDPLGNGTGGSGEKLSAEFNQRRHQAGTLAMARAQDIHSADSQFYIALAPQPHLDEQYTVFGQVVQGMDVVQKIKMGDQMLSFRFQITP